MITLFVLTGILISLAVALPLILLSLKDHRLGRYAAPYTGPSATVHRVPFTPTWSGGRRAA